MRQDSREQIPEELSKRFTRKLSREEWSRLHMGLGKTDLLALGHRKALGVLKDPAGLQDTILDAEEVVQQLGGQFADRYKAKARALARYMVHGEVTSQNLLRNAHDIAWLYGEQGTKAQQIKGVVSPDLIDAIDQMTSLYAYDLLDPEIRKTMAELSETEAEGIQTLSGVHASIRQMELERRDRDGVTNRVARNNGWKGYVPSLVQQGAALTVADDLKGTNLIRKGYVRVGTYKGDSNENSRKKRGYYQSTVAGKAAYRQGVAQTVHETWQGVDTRTGQTMPGTTAGLVLGVKAQRLAQALNEAPEGSLDGVTPGEYLIPVFDGSGQVTGYERSMDPKRLDVLPKDDHLGRMLGVCSTRAERRK